MQSFSEVMPRNFSSFIPWLGRFAVESGEYRIMAGVSSWGIRCEESICIESEDMEKRPLDYSNSMLDCMQDERYNKVMSQFMTTFHLYLSYF